MPAARETNAYRVYADVAAGPKFVAQTRTVEAASTEASKYTASARCRTYILDAAGNQVREYQPW